MKVEPGGLRELNEVKILVCRILNELKTPTTMTDLTEGMLADGLVNYFDYAIALSDLCVSGHVTKEKNAEGYTLLSLTAEGREADKLLGASLPLVVCEKVYAAVLASQSGGKAQCTVEQSERGYSVAMRFVFREHELFSIKLEAGDEMTAEDIRRNFLRDPHGIYLSLIGLIK